MYGPYATASVFQNPPSPAPASKCPYKNAGSARCSASIVRLTISKRRDAAYCSTDDFDNCPVFLGKVLRGR